MAWCRSCPLPPAWFLVRSDGLAKRLTSSRTPVHEHRDGLVAVEANAGVVRFAPSERWEVGLDDGAENHVSTSTTSLLETVSMLFTSSIIFFRSSCRTNTTPDRFGVLPLRV